MSELFSQLASASAPMLDAIRLEFARIIELTMIDPIFAASILVILSAIIAVPAYLVARRRRGRRIDRPGRALALAAKGVDRAEIARQTGLSHDAVAMLLHGAPGQHGRRNVPAAARIADETSDTLESLAIYEASQVVGKKALTELRRERHAAAHRLLFTVSQMVRVPRIGRAA